MARFIISPVKTLLPKGIIITRDERMTYQALDLLSSDVKDFVARKNAFQTLQRIYLTGSKKVKSLIEIHCEEAYVDTT
jgi:hypothetical protein